MHEAERAHTHKQRRSVSEAGPWKHAKDSVRISADESDICRAAEICPPCRWTGVGGRCSVCVGRLSAPLYNVFRAVSAHG